MTLDSDEKIDGYLGLYENDREEKLATMKNFRMVLPVFLVPGYRVAVAEKQLEANRKVYGADQLLDVFGIVELDQELLICNPLLARYGDRWYLVSASGIAFNVLGVDSRKQAFFTVNGTYESLLQALNR